MKPYVRPQPMPEEPQEECSAESSKPLKPYVKSQAKQVAYNTVLRVVA
ncbi:hypothetical protein ACFYY8_14510 [Streptosporangium sp. NPDC001559]